MANFGAGIKGLLTKKVEVMFVDDDDTFVFTFMDESDGWLSFQDQSEVGNKQFWVPVHRIVHLQEA